MIDKDEQIEYLRQQLRDSSKHIAKLESRLDETEDGLLWATWLTLKNMDRRRQLDFMKRLMDLHG